MQEKLEKNELVVDQLKRENARILQEKNLDVARLELGIYLFTFIPFATC